MMILKIIGLILFAIVCTLIILFYAFFEIASWYRESKYYTGWEDKERGTNR